MKINVKFLTPVLACLLLFSSCTVRDTMSNTYSSSTTTSTQSNNSSSIPSSSSGIPSSQTPSSKPPISSNLQNSSIPAKNPSSTSTELSEDLFINKAENAHDFLKIDDLTGPNSFELIHPKVVVYKDILYMAVTPYKNMDSKFENPTIYSSKDGVNWTFITQIQKAPISPSYNSDPLLFIKDDELHIWWRQVNPTNGDIIIYKAKTTDGKSWKNYGSFVATFAINDNKFLSPQVIYEDGTYKMWWVNSNRKLSYAESKDGNEWSEVSVKNISANEHYKLWHVDVIKHKGGFNFLFTVETADPNGKRYNLFRTSSKDNENFTDLKPLIIGRDQKWDHNIYQSSLVYFNNQWHLYYSGYSLNSNPHIGLIKLNKNKNHK